MRINEVTDSSSKLVQVLRTVISSADRKGTPLFLHFTKPKEENIKQGAKNLDLNKLMQNVGGEQFDYGTFQESKQWFLISVQKVLNLKQLKK